MYRLKKYKEITVLTTVFIMLSFLSFSCKEKEKKGIVGEWNVVRVQGIMVPDKEFEDYWREQDTVKHTTPESIMFQEYLEQTYIFKKDSSFQRKAAADTANHDLDLSGHLIIPSGDKAKALYTSTDTLSISWGEVISRSGSGYVLFDVKITNFIPDYGLIIQTLRRVN